MLDDRSAERCPILPQGGLGVLPSTVNLPCPPLQPPIAIPRALSADRAPSFFSPHSYHPLPVVFDRALGATVWDPEGNEYIDCLSAYSYAPPFALPAPAPC